MKTRNVLVTLLFFTSLMSTGCALIKPNNETLNGTPWNVTAYNNGQSIVSVLNNGKTLTANFGADGRLGGSAGCNSYSATYTASAADKSLILERIMSTKMACSLDGIMQQEQRFMAALRTVAIYQIEGDKLTLKTADGTVAVILTKK
jgi:heat shock protein HslJ